MGYRAPPAQHRRRLWWWLTKKTYQLAHLHFAQRLASAKLIGIIFRRLGPLIHTSAKPVSLNGGHVRTL
jgi:hypothetical protein